MQRVVFRLIGLGIIVSLLSMARADAQNKDLSDQIIKWAGDNYFSYTALTNFARHAPAPQVPVPPQVDPPCHVCGNPAKSSGEEQVDAWVTANLQPEAGNIKTLAGLAHDLALFKSVSASDLSPAAQKALAQFSETEMTDALVALGHRLYNDKAIPMAEKYDREPTRAYAGIKYLLETARAAALLNGLNGSSTSTDDNLAIELATVWTQSITSRIDQDILSGHKYNLCPVYAAIIRQVELLGGPSTDMTQFQNTLRQIDDVVRFDIAIELHAEGTTPDGAIVDMTWTGTSRMHLQLDLQNTCYTPKADAGGRMAVQVKNFTMIGIEHHSDGVVERVPVQLVSPRSFTVALEDPLLNLCDPAALLQIPFSALSFPIEEVESKGQRGPARLFASFLLGVIAPNNVNRSETDALTGRAPEVDPGKPTAAGTQTMDDAKAKIEAHKGDVAWLMGPEGQAAIAAIQKEALALAQPKLAAAGVSTPNVSSLAELAKSINAAHLDWRNGDAQPVNTTIRLDKDSVHLSLTVVLNALK